MASSPFLTPGLTKSLTLFGTNNQTGTKPLTPYLTLVS